MTSQRPSRRTAPTCGSCKNCWRTLHSARKRLERRRPDEEIESVVKGEYCKKGSPVACTAVEMQLRARGPVLESKFDGKKLL